jgi:uncharacterized protein (TIGR03437 family)
MMSAVRFFALLFTSTLPLFSQVLSNASLAGKYGFREVVLNSTTQQVQTLFGTLTFDGKGGYTLSAQVLSGSNAPANSTVTSGTYSVQSSGLATVSDPLQSGGQINARFSTGALIGSNTEGGPTSFSVFVAISAPASATNLATLNGTYWTASLEFLNGNPVLARETLFQMTANSTGGLGSPTAFGEAINLGNTQITQTIAAATYNMNADGTGSLSLPPPQSDPTQALIGGTKAIYVAGDGSFFIGGSTTAGGQGLIIGVKAASNPTNAILTGLYWSADLYARTGTYSCYSASADGVASGTLTWSKRLQETGGALDITTVTSYKINSDSSGNILDNNIAVSANGSVFIGSGLTTLNTDRYELFIGVRAPTPGAPAPPVTGTGMFLNPQGIANVFSFAPAGNPIAPGEFIVIFGTGLPPRSAVSVPFPNSLNGVQLMINNTAAPLYFIDANHVYAVVPYGITGSTASITLTNGTASSNAVIVPVAATSPGIATQAQNGLNAAAITHASGALITPTSPAVPGETVVLYMTGLGAVSPSVPDGSAAPSKTLSTTAAVQTIYLNGVCPNSPNCDASNIAFQGLTPGFAGLYQVNFVIPLTAAGGSAVPLAIQTANGFADMVTISIQQ